MPLRSIFVVILMVIGVYYALQAPFYALLVYLAYAYFRPEYWLWINVVPPNFSFITAAYVVLFSLLSGQRFVMNNRIALIFAFLVHSFISTLLSNYFTYGWVYWMDFFKSTIMTYFIIILVTDFTKFRLVLLIMALFIGVEGAKQGWVYLLTAPGSAVNLNGQAILGDNNGTALGMLMLVPVIALLAQTTQHRWSRYGFWFLLIGVLYRSLSTHSRGGFLACMALGGTYLLRSRQRWRVLLGIAVVVALVLPALPEKFWDRMHTIQTYDDEETKDSSIQGRLHFWSVAVDMANAHPLLGIGYNCYNAAYNTYDFSQGKYRQNRAVHSSYFGVLAELGYVGATLYGLIILSALQSCRRVHKLAGKHPTLLALSQSATALETSFVVFLVGGAFLSYQYKELVWHFIVFTIVLEEIAKRYVLAAEGAEGELADVAVIGAAVSTMDERA